MESTMLRAQTAAASKGEAASSVMIDAAPCSSADAAERVVHEAERAIGRGAEGEHVTTPNGRPGGFASARKWTRSRCAAALPQPYNRRSLSVRRPLRKSRFFQSGPEVFENRR